MKVSIIVSIYNGADILNVTLPPLINQDYPKEKTEIIFVNDGSTDATPKLLEPHKPKKYITVITHSTNMGRTITRNSGIKKATGELLLFLDCDIEVKTDFISKHVNYHQNKNVIGVVSHICTTDVNSKDKFYKYIFFGKRGAPLIGENKPIPFKYFIMGCSSIKSSAVAKTGFFNENLKGYGIDLEYANRLEKNYQGRLFYSEKIKVIMHKVKILDEVLSDYHQYGQLNVPIILKESPRLAPFVGADYIKSLNGNITLKIILGTIFINPPIFQLVKLILYITPFPLSNILIRYLLAASVAMGYRKHLKKIN